MEKVKVVLLTGGSSGIGAATAHLLASAGMKVYAGSRRGTIDEPQEGINIIDNKKVLFRRKK